MLRKPQHDVPLAKGRVFQKLTHYQVVVVVRVALRKNGRVVVVAAAPDVCWAVALFSNSFIGCFLTLHRPIGGGALLRPSRCDFIDVPPWVMVFEPTLSPI